MAVDKNFVVKNGLEVNEDLLFADDVTSKVGIGLTIPSTKLDVIGDASITGFASVGIALSTGDGLFTGVSSAHAGLDVGLGGTVVHVRTLTQKVGINSVDPTYTTDLRGPVSTGTTALFVFGDVEVTGNISCTQLEGQVADGGSVGFSTVVASDNLDGPASNVYGVFNVEDTTTEYNFIAGGNDPVSIGFTQTTQNPELFLMRGQKYHFNVNVPGFPFLIKTQQTSGSSDQYTDGVIGNGAEVGVVTFNVPFNSPDILFYNASNQSGMGGQINIVGVYTGASEFLNITGIATIANAEITNLTVTGFSTLTGAGASITFLEVVGFATLGNAGASGINVSGVVTAAQFAGIATGADDVHIDRVNSDTEYQLTFVTQGSDQFERLNIDSDVNHLRYNPADEVLRVGIFSGDLHGTAQKTLDVLYEQRSDNVNYQIGFTTAGSGGDFQRTYVDSEADGLTYNPGTNTLTVGTLLAGNVAGTASTATDINISNTNDAGNHYLVFTDGAANNSNQRPEVDSDLTYVPSTNTLTAGNLAGAGDNLTNLNASNLSQGTVPGDRGVTAGSASASFVEYNGTTRTNGQFYGGTQNPNNTTRLNYNGDLHATEFNGPLNGNAATASQVNVTEDDTNTGSVLFATGTGNQSVLSDNTFTYNSNTNLLTVGSGSVNAPGDNNNFGNTSLDQTTVESLNVTNNTASTSNTTGAVTVTGGVGIGGALNVGGDITAFATSDERLKDNIEPIPNALLKMKKISGNTFDWNEESSRSGRECGVIAQEIESLGLPGLVETRDNGYKAVRYEKLVPLLIEAIKELTERVQELEK